MLSHYLRQVLTHSVLYGMSNSSAMLVGLLLIPLYTRSLSVQEFGALSLVNTYGTFLIFLFDLGLITAFVRHYYDYGDHDVLGRSRLVSTLFWFVLGVSGLLAVVFYLAAPGLNPLVLGSYQGLYLLQLMTLTVLINTVGGVPMTVFRVQQHPGSYLGLSLAKAVGVLVLVPLLVIALGRGVAGVFEGYLWVSLSVVLGAFALSRDQYRLTFCREDLQAILKMGLVFWPAMMLGWVIDFSDLYVLRHFHDLDRVGVYSLGYKVGQLLFYAALAFSIGWAPILFRILREPDANEILGRLLKYYTLVLVSLALLLSVLSGPIIALVGTPAYAQAATVVPLVSAAYVLYGLFFFFLNGALIAKQFRVQTLALAVGAALNIALNMLLIPAYHIYGAAAATVCSYGVVCVLGYLGAQRAYAIPYRLREVAMVCGAGVVAYLAYYGAREMTGSDLMGQGMAVASYVALLLATGALAREELRGIWLRSVRASGASSL